jgi:uncharacterized protein YjbI with pentapeptide repeats
MLKDCWAWLAEISKNEILRSGFLVFALAVAAVVVLVLLERRWEKIPKKKRILRFFMAVLVITVVMPKPLLWPKGWGIGPEQSTSTVSIETLEKDTQGNTTKTVKTTKNDDGKTLWDWLSVLGVPLSLALLGFWLQTLQQSRAEALAKEEVLQVYFDRLSVLLVDKNLRAIAAKKDQVTDEERELLASAMDVIRARTLSILRRFENDPERKTSVIRFLIEADFISKLKLNLDGATLRGCDLRRADLRGANLRKADLSEADLNEANLSEADLNEANLSNSSLSHAILNDANIKGANLSRSILRYANLKGAELKEAKLNGANLIHCNLSHSILSRADFSDADLSNAILRGARMPLAILRGANLSSANLSNANLGFADLSNANLNCTDLFEAELLSTNLSESHNLTAYQLNMAKLCRTRFPKLPEGITFDPDHDCKALGVHEVDPANFVDIED